MIRKKIYKSIIAIFTLLSLFSVNAFAYEADLSGKVPGENNNHYDKPNYNNNSKPGGNGGSNNSNKKPSNAPGTEKNPYIKKISVPSYLQYNTRILPAFNRLAAGEGNAKVTAHDFTISNGKSHITKIKDNNGDETYVKWLYPVVTVTRNTTNKVKEVDRKNDYFNWVATGPESWTKNTSSNRLTHTFTKVGKYKIVYTPHQLVTTSHQNFTNTKAVAYYPANGSSNTLLSKDTAGKLTTTQNGVWRTDYRQVWEFEITAADVGKPIDLDPKNPPTTNPVDPNGGDPEGLLESETQLIQ